MRARFSAMTRVVGATALGFHHAVFFVALSSLAVSTYAEEPKKLADPKKVTTVEGVTEYRLDNGARVLLFPDPSRPTISVNMTVLVGSRHEGYGEAGMAHLLEHLVFKGTPTFPDVPTALRDHGAGSSFNGTTNEDRTNYFETLPANDDNLDFAIHLEADRLVNSYIRREDLMSEFSVVRSEFERGENSPAGILSQRVSAAAFEWHNYGKTTIGNRSDIERVPIHNLQAFYRKYYQPDNAVLIVTGKFEEAKALQLIQKYLGAIPRPERKLDAAYTEEPAQDGERNVVLRRVGSVGSVLAVYHIPASTHVDWAPLSILGSVISEEKKGRLYEALVESKLATSAFARADNLHDAGLFSVSATPTEGNLDQVSQVLVSTMEELEKMEISQDDVDQAKIRAKRRFETTLTNSADMMQALSSASALGDWRLLFLQRDRVANVTAADVNRVAKTYFKRHNRTLGLFIPSETPQRLNIPTGESAETLVAEYKGGVALEAGEAFEPTPENLDKRTKVVEMDGVKIAMIPKENRGDTVSLALTLHYGNENSLKEDRVAAGMMASMMMAGTKRLDRQALQQELDRLGIRISQGGGRGGRGGGRGGRGGGGGGVGQVTFSIEAKRDSLIQGIQLLGEILRQPAFPADEFEQMKSRSMTATQSMQTEPSMLANIKMSRALSSYPQGDVRYVPTTEESLKELEEVSLDQVVGVYEEQLSSAQTEVAIVGDFDPEEAVSAIGTILKDWKSKTKIARIDREASKQVKAAKEDIVTVDKADAIFMAGMAFEMNEEHPDSAALRLGNYILGGGTLSSRLGVRIRQKEGLSYGVNSSMTTPTNGNDARFSVVANCNPMNIDALEAAALQEIESFVKEGPTEKEVEDAKQAFLEAQKVGRAGDGAIAGQILANLEQKRTFAYVAQQEERIRNLTAKDIQVAFMKHIDPKKLVVIRAGDFKK